MATEQRYQEQSQEDRLLLTAFILGVHIRSDINTSEITRHSPLEIAETANTRLLKNGKCHVKAEDVIEVFQRLLRLLG